MCERKGDSASEWEGNKVSRNCARVTKKVYNEQLSNLPIQLRIAT